jgi:hypothetical protein
MLLHPELLHPINGNLRHSSVRFLVTGSDAELLSFLEAEGVLPTGITVGSHPRLPPVATRRNNDRGPLVSFRAGRWEPAEPAGGDDSVDWIGYTDNRPARRNGSQCALSSQSVFYQSVTRLRVWQPRPFSFPWTPKRSTAGRGSSEAEVRSSR